MSFKRIFVTLSTGKQGRAMVKALSNAQSFDVVALTRSKSSAVAQSLAQLPHVELVEGNTNDDQDAVYAFEQASLRGPLDVLVMILQGVDNPGGVHTGEVQQAQRLIRMAKQYSVKHIVYSSVDFGGSNDTGAEHVESKRKIESLLESDFVGDGKTHTILRPTALYENMANLPSAAFTVRMLTKMVRKPLYWVSTQDIAKFALLSIKDPQAFDGRKISLAGDLIDREKFVSVWKANGLPESTLDQVLEAAVLKVFEANPPMKKMNKFLNEHGYQADIDALRKEVPSLLDLDAWLRENISLFTPAP